MKRKEVRKNVSVSVGEAVLRPPPRERPHEKGRGFQRAVLSVARITMRMRMAVSSMRMRITHRRTRTRITARGLQTVKYLRTSQYRSYGIPIRVIG